jgi:ATP/maltotriose-dependent transcriptional regulator MalT
MIEAEMYLSQRRFTETKASATQVLKVIGTKPTATAVQIKSVLGMAQIFSGAKAEGKQSCREAVEMAAGISDPWLLSHARLALATAEFETGEFKQAQADAVAAQEGFASLGSPQSQWRAALIAARALKHTGDDPKAREYASHIPGLLSGIRQRWGADSYNSYLTRPDVQLLRKLLQDEFALSS